MYEIIFIVSLTLIYIYILNKIIIKLNKLNDENKTIKENNKKLLSQKKSSEIRLGKIGEQFSPFLYDWPWDSNNFRFLATPIDGIQFNDDEIVFVEIKTGKSNLTKKQKNIKEIVNNKKIKFVTFRVDEKGCFIK